MAVLLVATFPILLLMNGPVAFVSLAVGSLLLYLDNRPVTRNAPALHTAFARGTLPVVSSSETLPSSTSIASSESEISPSSSSRTRR